MPIRPEMRAKYPPRKEWKRIRAEILARAENRCEICRVPNRVVVCRGDGDDTGSYMLEDGKLFDADTGEFYGYRRGSEYVGHFVAIVLTIAHLDHDPSNSDRSNLRALCQLHHLRLDKHEHARNAAKTRRNKRDARTGQQRLLNDELLGFQKGDR